MKSYTFWEKGRKCQVDGKMSLILIPEFAVRKALKECPRGPASWFKPQLCHLLLQLSTAVCFLTCQTGMIQAQLLSCNEDQMKGNVYGGAYMLPDT